MPPCSNTIPHRPEGQSRACVMYRVTRYHARSTKRFSKLSQLFKYLLNQCLCWQPIDSTEQYSTVQTVVLVGGADRGVSGRVSLWYHAGDDAPFCYRGRPLESTVTVEAAFHPNLTARKRPGFLPFRRGRPPPKLYHDKKGLLSSHSIRHGAFLVAPPIHPVFRRSLP